MLSGPVVEYWIERNACLIPTAIYPARNQQAIHSEDNSRYLGIFLNVNDELLSMMMAGLVTLVRRRGGRTEEWQGLLSLAKHPARPVALTLSAPYEKCTKDADFR
jgi:hypothetical protein